MFCNKCGAQLPDGSLFCGKCGNALPLPTPAENVAAVPPVVEPVVAHPPVEESAPVEISVVEMAAVEPAILQEPAYIPPTEMSPEAPATPKKKRSLTGRIIGIVAALCVVAIGVMCILHFLPSKFQPLVEDAMAVEYKMEISGLKEMAPSQAWEKLKRDHDVTIDDLVSQQEYAEAAKYIYGLNEEDEERLGKNIRYSVKVLKEYDIPAKGYEQVLERLQNTYDIPRSMVGEMQEVYCEVALTGDKETAYVLTGYIAVEVDGTWYLMNGDRFVAEYMASCIVREAKGSVESDAELDF